MEICYDGSNSTTFDLTLNTPLVLDDQDPDQFYISYHTSLADAEVGSAEITSPEAYEDAVPGVLQTIFVRIENIDHEECYDISEFDIELFEVTAGPMTPLESCSPNADGYAVFVLNDKDEEALGDQIPGDYTVTYYVTESEANLAVDDTDINLPYVNETPYSQIVWVRVSNNENPDCYEIAPLELVAHDTPEAITPADILQCDDGSGVGVFDLTMAIGEILAGQDAAQYNVSFHVTQSDADNDATPIADPTSHTIDPVVYPYGGIQTIYVRAENTEMESCYDTTSFEIGLYNVSIGAVDTLYACDSTGDGFASFDLYQNTAAALNGQEAIYYAVSYHATEQDAIDGTGDLPNFGHVATSGTVWVRVQNNANPVCYEILPFEILAETFAEVTPPTPLEVCDTDNDGFAGFMLTDKDEEILDGVTGVTVSYHSTASDAANNLNALTSPYDNVVPYSQTVYVNVQDMTSGCNDVVELELIVNDSPMITQPTEPLVVCNDDLGDEVAVFDLTDANEEILNGLSLTGYGIGYYLTFENAEGQLDPIATPTSYENLINPQTVYVRVTDLDNGCYNIVPLELVVNLLPEPVQPTPLEACDDGESGSDTDQIVTFDLTVKEAEITGNDNSIGVSWYENALDESLDNPILDPTAYNNIENAQTVTARLTDENGCSSTITLTLIVNPLPSPVPNPEPYVVCDTDNDGFAEFDLEGQVDLVIEEEPQVEVTFYANPQDAEAGNANTLSSPYTNTQIDQQTVYVRATNEVTGCYRVVELELVVDPLPEIAGEPADLFACDLDGDGTETFDLTQGEADIYGGQDPSEYTITYYEDQTAANDGVGGISQTEVTVYQSTGAVIWVRLENNETGCYDIGSFEVIVGATPVIADPMALHACDDMAGGGTNDGIAYFDLTDANEGITTGINSYSVYYYGTQADMEADSPIADFTQYQNPSNNYTVYVKVLSEEGCEAFTTLTLVVDPLPSIADEVFEYELCDVDNDGFAEFDLASQSATILDGEVNVAVSYHTTALQAEDNLFPIDTAFEYGNIVANVQTIYIRATNMNTGCYVTREMLLIVNATPVIEEVTDLVQCDASGDETAVFDLTVQEDIIFGTADPSGYLVSYHETEQEAIDGVGDISDPGAYTNIDNPQVIWLRVEDSVTGCFSIADFEIEVEQLPVANQPEPLKICNDDYDDPAHAIFDLTVKDNEIAGTPFVPAGVEVYYYASQEDFDNNVPIENPEEYENVSNPQDIFVLVVNTNSQDSCVSSTTLVIEVLPIPSPSETDPEVLQIEECDDDTDGITGTPFDLTASGGLIAGGENVVLLYYLNEEDAHEGDPDLAIQTPEAYVNTTPWEETIYVRVENATNGNDCFIVLQFNVVVNPLPIIANDIDTPYEFLLCEPADGNASQGQVVFWEVTHGMVPDLLHASEPLGLDEVTVTYHETETDAIDGTNPLPDGYTVTDADNGADLQTVLYIRVENTETGCANTNNIGSIIFDVEPEPLAVGIDEPLEACSYDTFDLTVYGEMTVAQPAPADYSIAYYTSELDAQLQENAIENPTAHEGTDGQVIYVRVVNNVTMCASNIVTFGLQVNPEPVMELPEDAVVCTDPQGNVLEPFEIGEDLGPGFTYQWNTGETTAVIAVATLVPNTVNTLSVTVTDTNFGTGCSGTYSVAYTPSSAPESMEITVNTDAFSDQYSVTATPVGGTGVDDGDPSTPMFMYSIDGGPFQPTGEFSGLEPGEHEVVIMDVNGCGQVSQSFGLIDYPNFFTPNGDGHNDTWNIIGIEGQPSAKIYIFDRFGKLLKQLSPTGPGWDGTYNGAPMPSTDYWFRIEYIEPRDGTAREFKANFSLKR